jgi:Uncharacterized protein conserved in bacteria (DUF2252)
MSDFFKKPQEDQLLNILNYQNDERGAFFYFRSMSIRMQERFATLINHKDMPRVFLHGNPHLENFVITDKGAAMVDFDRSRMGPYAWDIVRFLSSVALKNKNKKYKNKLLSDIVLEYFIEGYLRGLFVPDMPFKQISALLYLNPTSWNRTTNEYIKSNGKWFQKIKENPLPLNDEHALAVLNGYLQSRNEDKLLETYHIEHIGQAMGSFGNRRFLFILAPKVILSEADDRIFLDIKTVYQDADNEFYKNPFPHHGQRMIKASEIYAPNIELRMGFCTYNGTEYWGRQVPPFTIKLRDKMNVIQQLDFAYSVGSQLGQAHAKTLQDGSTIEQLYVHLKNNYSHFTELAVQMNTEILEAHKLYLAELKKLNIKIGKKQPISKTKTADSKTKTNSSKDKK